MVLVRANSRNSRHGFPFAPSPTSPYGPPSWVRKRTVKNVVITPRSDGMGGKADRVGYFDIRFPIEISTKINAATARKESVRVEARAPSGRVMEMGVGEANGCYTANFTPTEVGDWSISIFYENIHIQGSPFQVRVYDAAQVKVFGLEGGAVGQNFSFSADCSSAGQGELTVDIKHDGLTVPSSIERTGSGTSRINFVPRSPGMYNIKVYFAGVEIEGSPYTLDIVDSSVVRATGEGLSAIEVGKRAVFEVNTHGAYGGDIRVNITGPSGTVPCQVLNAGDGIYRIEYTPTDVGEYQIDITYYGKPIMGSPFRALSSDWNKIRVLNLRPNGQVGRPVEFQIDASAAGSGNLEIMVNEGTIPCSVQNRGKRLFHASFVPKEPGTHLIQMRFNGREVPDSPWRVDVQGTTHVTTTGTGLQLVSARSLASFEVRTGSTSGDVKATVYTPSQRMVPVQVINQYNGSYRVEYTPSEVGIHTIDVRYNNIPIPGSPFSAKVYDPASIIISPIPHGIVGKPVEFTIDVNQAGEGQLEIMVNRGSVPNTVKMLRKGVFKVTFIPRDSREHQVDVKFNGELLQICPVVVPILDASRVTVHGEGIRQVAVNRNSYFRVNTQSAGEADLNVRVTAPNGDLVPAKMVAQPDGDYKVEYSSKYTGRHTVEILYAGHAIMGSPFFVEIYDPNKIRVEGVTNGVVGQNICFDILRHEAGKAELGLSIRSPSGREVHYTTNQTPQGDRITYTPEESGAYLIYITYGGLEVPGCPLTQRIDDDSSSVTVYGDGLHKGEAGRPVSFIVKTKPDARGDLWVQVDGPNSIAKCNIEAQGPGIYKVTYVPVEQGRYVIQIKLNGKPVIGCPYHPMIGRSGDATKVLLLSSGPVAALDPNGALLLRINQSKRLEFDTSQAGSGTLSAKVMGPNNMAFPCDVHPLGVGKYVVTFTPTVEGYYNLFVMWDEQNIPNSPFHGTASRDVPVVNHEKVVLTGRGLKEARVRDEAEFIVDGRSAGPGLPDVRLEGVKNSIEVTTLPIGNNMYRCVYRPTIPGAYLLYIKWSDRQVRGSPFKISVGSNSDASSVVCTGEGLKVGVMGQEIKSVIDTRRAGPGELTAHCQGPRREAYCSLYNNHDGTFTLTIKPQEAGRHILTIKYDDEHVPGSPFNLRISGAPDASKVVVKGPGVEHGLLALYKSHFMVETRGAGAGQLTVRVRGPKGAFRVEMQRESSKDRSIMCRYDPTEVGDYVVHIKWSGEHVPGSPFHVHIADTEDELHKYISDGYLNSMQSTRTMESRAHNMDF